MKIEKKLFLLMLGACMLAISGTALATEGYGDCQLFGKHASEHITPAVPGQFTVLINLPATGEFNGDTPNAIKDGREFCMAVNIAYRLGLDKVVLRNASFDSIVAGQHKDYDIALALVTITKPRQKVVDFSVPYDYGAIGIAERTGSDIDATSVKTARIGAQAGTTMISWIQNKFPDARLSVFQDTGAMFTALAAHNVDVVMTDISVILGQVAHSNGRLKVAGMYKTGAQTAGIYPKGSASEEVINKVIDGMREDGTLAKLEKAYLVPSWGGLTRDDVPVWKP